MKMKERNAQLKNALGAMATKERIAEVASIPAEDTVTREGCPAYSLEDELRLLSMLNTLKIQDQYYRSENETIRELRDLIERIGMNKPYFLAQAIVYSRCMGEGMRAINQLAATLAAPFISGTPWAKSFYSIWDRKRKQGGVIYRVDDMSAIKDAYSALNGGSVLSNAMKKGFANALINFDAYSLAKYKSDVIDIANLVHPISKKSKAIVTINGKEVNVLDGLMNGITISPDTWEVAQSEAGQEVAKAVKDGKLTKDEAAKVLSEQKNANWEALLSEGKLGILAALRNIRNMLKDPKKEVIDKLCDLIQDGKKIRDGLIMPYQLDLAYMIIEEEFPYCTYGDRIKKALRNGYETALPNLASALPGKTLCVVDTSGSMMTPCTGDNKSRKYYRRTAMFQAALMAATIAKGTNGDIMTFSDDANWYGFRHSDNVFSIAHDIEKKSRCGGTNFPAVFDKLRTERKKYDRIIILSDQMCNAHSYYTGNWVSGAYKQYVHDVCSPYVYCVDLAAYGTTMLPQNNKISYYFGYGYAMIEDIAKNEFNPTAHIDKVRKVVIDPNYIPFETDI